jgi:hypothetical protein
LADGTRLGGYLTPPGRAGDSIGTIQPVIVTSEGQVDFWYGIMEPTRDVLAVSYARLGRDAAAVFPLAFRSEVEATGCSVTGTLNGYLYMRSLNDPTVVELQ